MNKVIALSMLIVTLNIGAADTLPSDTMKMQEAIGSLALFGDTNVQDVREKIKMAKSKKGLAKAIALSKSADALEQLVSPVVVILNDKKIQTVLKLIKADKLPNGLKVIEAFLEEFKNLQQELTAE